MADSAQVAGLTLDRLGVAAEKLVTWPIFAADPDAPQARPWQPGETLRIGSLGRLHPNKGYDILIEALAKMNAAATPAMPPYRVAIAGEGADEASLRSLAAGRGVDQLDFVGFSDTSADFLAGLHLYVQPSRREGFCIAAHEAMQAGLPVIVSKTGEMPLTVDTPTIGRVVEVADAQSLAAALGELLKAPHSLAPMGIAARERVLHRFSQERFELNAAEIVRRLEGLVSRR